MSLGVGLLLGWPPLQGIVIGIVISVASTMVLARLLLDRGELHSRHGRIMVGITPGRGPGGGCFDRARPRTGDGGGRTAPRPRVGVRKGRGPPLPLGYLASRVVSPLMTRVARTHNQELFLLVALAIGLGRRR